MPWEPAARLLAPALLLPLKRDLVAIPVPSGDGSGDGVKIVLEMRSL